MLVIDEKYLLLSELQQWECLHNPEMPTSGNLKSEDSLFLALPRLSQWSAPPPPLIKYNSIQSLIGLGHYMKSYMRYRTITISVYDWNGEIIFVTDKIHAKMPQKPSFDWQKIRILEENGKNSKLKHRIAHNSILSGRFADPYRRRLLSYPGELARMIIILDN